jgi:hypothetical protein
MLIFLKIWIVDTGTEYDDGIKYSFLERLDLANEEIKYLTTDMTKVEAMNYFKKETEVGNIHYWGNMFFCLYKCGI